MENNLKLKEQKNTVQIIGELKDIKLNWGKKDKNGREFVSGNLIVKVTNKHGVGEHRLNIMQYKTYKSGSENNFFKALKTIENKYNTIERDGQGTILKAMATIDENTYYNASKDVMVEGITLKPYKISSYKDEEADKVEQGVLASVGGYLDNIFKDENGKVTCRLATVNFFGNLIPIQCEVKPELADAFLDNFENESTVKSFKIEIIKAAKVSEAAKSSNEDEFDGFGDCEEIEDEIITDYINANMIIGGKPGFDPEINLDEEAVKEAYKQRELALASRLEEERAKKVEDDFSTEEGFGTDSDDMDDDLPF